MLDLFFLALIMDHGFSIGLRSGEYAVQSKNIVAINLNLFTGVAI